MAGINVPPVVNDQGNINVHKHEGAVIPISMQDNQGSETDIATLPLYFEVTTMTPVFRKALAVDPSNPEGRLLIITPEDLEVIPHGASFCITDESNPTFSVHRWEGRIFKRG